MEKKERIINILRENKLEELDKFNQNSISNILIEILDEEINTFDYEKDIDYLNELIKLLPKYINNKKQVHESLEKIHQKIKTYLVQKPGNVEKTNHNYKQLKNIINNIELIQISILYDYNDKYEESKYKLIDYILFDLKNITFFKDAIQRFPHLVNYFDENDKKLIVTVVEKYMDEVVNYTKEQGIDNIIYYDEIINLIMKSPKFIFDIVDKQTILREIKQKTTEIHEEKNRKTFYLNNLIEKINGEEELNNSYLEYKYNIPTYFNEAIKSEVKRITKNYSLSKNRVLINDLILTFDSEDAKEIDDALSINILENNNILLGVHIADPTSIIDENSIIFDEAAKRTTSIYLSDKTHSMFPIELSGDLISLKENEYRPAISYYFELNEIGDVINTKYFKSIIKVRKNMTYEEFNTILNSNQDSNIKRIITNLSKLSTILQRYYNEDPLYFKINRTHNNITNTNITGMSNGEKVVESTMVFTNYMVAKYFKEHKLPFIYRNHTINQEMMNKLDKLKYNIMMDNKDDDYLKYIEIVKNIYPKAMYESEVKGHFGLGLDCYCHITSPLRRFSDVIALICLEKLYFNNYNEATIEEVKQLVIKNTNRINAKRNSIEQYMLKYENLTVKEKNDRIALL